MFDFWCSVGVVLFLYGAGAGGGGVGGAVANGRALHLCFDLCFGLTKVRKFTSIAISAFSAVAKTVTCSCLLHGVGCVCLDRGYDDDIDRG